MVQGLPPQHVTGLSKNWLKQEIEERGGIEIPQFSCWRWRWEQDKRNFAPKETDYSKMHPLTVGSQYATPFISIFNPDNRELGK